jgi:hypothetical protein
MYAELGPGDHFEEFFAMPLKSPCACRL